MEAIKCPNCGSEKVQELTEEKYACLACDNVFLIHNLSKEFRQTDKHISDVHADLSRKIDNLNAGMQNISMESSGDAFKAKTVLNAAEELLKKGDFLKAYENFKTYTVYMPDSYVGYEGMFRALTDNYMDDAGQYKRIASDMTEATVKNLLADGTDVLSKALQCEDCNKGDLLNKYKEYYERSLETLQARILYNTNPNNVEEILNLAEKKVGAKDNTRERIAQCEREIEQTNAQIVENKKNVEFSQKEVSKFNALSEAEQKAIMKGKKIKSGVTFGVVLILAILLWGHVGLFLHIVEVIVVLFVGLICIGSLSAPSVYEGNENELEQKLEKQKNELQALEELLVAQENKKSAVGIDELENFILKSNSFAKSAEELYAKYSELEKPKEKTGYDVFWTDCTAIKSSSLKYVDVCKHGGYRVFKPESPSLPQIVLAKSTKNKSDALLQVGYSDKTMKFLREISDDRMYTLLLMPMTQEQWFDIEKSVFDVYSSIIKEITGKIAPDAQLGRYDESSVVRKATTRVITRSEDKQKLTDYAERLTDIGIDVKVI